MDRDKASIWLELTKSDPDAPTRSADAAEEARAQAIASFDRELGAAIRDVPIPAGFEARLKARLAAAAKPKWYRKPTRRQWTVGASVAAALVIGLGFWLFPFSDPAWTNAKVRAAALATYHRPSAWPKGQDESLRAQLPSRIDPRYVVAAQEIRFHGKTVTAFELRKGEQDALLLVAQSHYFVEPLDMDSFGEHGGTLFVTYVVEREEGEVCIAVARSLAPFERSVIEL